MRNEESPRRRAAMMTVRTRGVLRRAAHSAPDREPTAKIDETVP